ncbi:MAG TPA: molecular chaperone TorD family protein [Gammaproteobacteria bacterium]|nr:molecular chaperone TorD family protein [Gammaproteobacteria bacterium]
MTTAQSTQSSEAVFPAARCRIYREFATAFSHPDSPDSGQAPGLMGSAWSSGIRGLARLLPYEDPFAPISDPAALSTDALSEIYSSTFDVGQGALSSYGRSYPTREEKPLFEELFRFYEHFGLAFDNGLPEWPDWIVVELEFMHYLSFLEAESSSETTSAALRRGQRDFLERQLVEFATGFTAALNDAAVPVYADIAHFLRAFVRADFAYLERVAA